MARPLRVALIAAAALAPLGSRPHAQNAPAPSAAETIKAQIVRALASALRNYERLLTPAQAGVHVLNVDVRETAKCRAIAIDLS